MDSKKLDKLIKLIRLANHNNTDGEANAAARAVCRIFSEDNYKWIDKAQKNGGEPPRHEPETKSSIYEESRTRDVVIRIKPTDIHNNPAIGRLLGLLKEEVDKIGTWAGVHRSKEPYWRSAPPPNRGDGPFGSNPHYSAGFDWDKWDKDFFKNFGEEQRREEESRRKYRQYERHAQSWTWTGERPDDKKYHKVYKQHVRDCTVCGITRLTCDEDTPYICYECKKRR